MENSATFEAVARVRQLVGDRFLSYVLNRVIERGEAPISDLSQQQQEVVGTLVALLRSVVDDVTAAIQIAPLLGQYVAEAGASLPNVLRQHAGGDLPEASTSTDPVLRQVCTQLDDAYPLLLLPVDRFMPRPFLAALTFNHPNRQQLEAAVLADPVLRELFTTEQQGSGWTGNTFRSTGQGGGIQLWGLADQQICVAWERARFDTAWPSIEAVRDNLDLNLRTLRRAIQGKQATTPVRLGLTGVLLPAGTDEVEFGWARIRRVAEQDREVIRQTGLEGKLQTTTPDGTEVVIDYAGDVVATFEVPYKVVIQQGDLDVMPPWPTQLSEIQGQIGQAVENLRLGLALSADPDTEPTLAVFSWQVTLDPLASTASPGWTDTRRVMNLRPRQLTDADVHAWQRWSDLVREHRTKSTAIAIRRMLQALAERQQQDDVLVDAVIVWENLFGAAQETTLRISTALAWLLGTDAEDRAVRQDECKKLYNLRSEIVHGSDKLKAALVPEAAQEAVHISLNALRKMFAERQDLLRENNSATRAILLLLDRRPEQ